MRRWIDATGSYAVVGRLIAADATTVEILRQDGRRVAVPLERLSDFDRGYAVGAGSRMAGRGRSASPRDTAGL